MHFKIDTTKILLIKSKSKCFRKKRRTRFWYAYTNKEILRNMRNLQKNKIFRHKLYDKFSSLFVSKFKWIDFIMNFVTNFFESKTWNETKYDVIFVVMNRLIKMTYYIFVIKIVIAKIFVEILIREIIRFYEFSSSITTNRNSIFILKYHNALCYVFKFKFKFFTIYYFQTNDQTKRQNSIMKQYFKIFVNFKQHNWIKLLSMIEFIYNNNKHAFTKMSSFEIMQKYTSKMIFEKFVNFKIKFKFLKKHVEKLIELIKILKTNLTYAQKQQIKYKNVKIKLKHFDVNNYVNVNDKKIRIKRNKKLKWKFFKLFKTLNIVENQTYRIDISKRWRIHDVFYILLFEKVKIKRKKKISLKFNY